MRSGEPTTSDSSRPTPEDIPTEVLHQLYRGYCLAKFPYSQPTVDGYDRDGHIDYDARSYYSAIQNEEGVEVDGHIGPLAELVKAAYAAGRESALTRDEWRTCFWLNRDHPDPRVHVKGVYGKADDEAEVAQDLAAARKCWPDAWIEHRRTGASEWKRVPDA